MYSSTITRNSQALFVILIDQSGSMDEKICINSRTTTKAEYVAQVSNALISELINRCRREEGVRDYFNIVSIGYRDNRICSLVSDDFRPVTPSQLSSRNVPRMTMLQERKLANGKTTIGNFPQTMWIEPHAAGNTPMYEAMAKAHGIIARWTSDPRNRCSYPPVVINISDGEATDADHSRLEEMAEGIKRLGTDDGNTLIINIHITADHSACKAMFPCSPEELPADRNALALYNMSSPMPEVYNPQIMQVKKMQPLSPPFRGVSYNTPVTELVAMMNIGSASVSLIQ